MCQNDGSGGIRTHASEETGALNQRLRPLGHATSLSLCPCRSPHGSLDSVAHGRQTRAAKSRAASHGAKMIPPRIELGTFCVLGRCDNRYTTESSVSDGRQTAVKAHPLGSRDAHSKPSARCDSAKGKRATAGNRTRINCLEGNYAHHYTTVASCEPTWEQRQPFYSRSVATAVRTVPDVLGIWETPHGPLEGLGD